MIVVGTCNEPGVVFSLFAQTTLMIMLRGGTTGFPSSRISKPQLQHHTPLGEAGPHAKVTHPYSLGATAPPAPPLFSVVTCHHAPGLVHPTHCSSAPLVHLSSLLPLPGPNWACQGLAGLSVLPSSLHDLNYFHDFQVPSKLMTPCVLVL